MGQGKGRVQRPTLVCSLSFSLLRSLSRSRPRSSPSGPAMKADGLARKAPKRWAQVSRLKGPMVRRSGPAAAANGDQVESRGRQRAPEPLRQPERATVSPGPLAEPSHPRPRAHASRDPAPGSRDETKVSRVTLGWVSKVPAGRERRRAGAGAPAGRWRRMRAENSLGRSPAAGTETTAPPRPPAPVVTGRPRSPRLTQLRAETAGRLLPDGRGRAHGAWAAGTGRTPLGAGQ